MLKPKRLRLGDKVAIVAPASPFTKTEFDEGVAELERLGFEPTYEPSVFAKLGGYLSGDGRLRARAFLDAWRDPSIGAIIAARGGYGSVHMLPYFDRAMLRDTPKPFIGYSDVTSVLTFLTVGCEIVSFHGPMLAGKLGKGTAAYDPDSMLRALTRAEPLGELAAASMEAFRPGEATGPLYGGTLAQLVAGLGTPFAFAPPEGYVLFLEDVAERPYRLDRMLTQLRLAGILESAAGIVLGEFVGCDEPGGEPAARAVLAELLKDFNGPVVFGFPSGHTAGPAMTLPLGVRARVIANGTPRVIIEEAGVE
jgi:muramoyltetrapeptide carboxypeptidase